MRSSLWFGIVLLASACSGDKTASPSIDIPLAHAPRCAPGAALVHPVAIYAKSGSMQFFGAYTGNPELPATATVKAKGPVTLKFGLCPNTPSGRTYTCSSNNHDGVRYYAERKVDIDSSDPNTARAEFVEPIDGMLCTDGKRASAT